jgi:hypothetical protein
LRVCYRLQRENRAAPCAKIQPRKAAAEIFAVLRAGKSLHFVSAQITLKGASEIPAKWRNIRWRRHDKNNHYINGLDNGWGAWIRTREWRNQNPLPYHLATPHCAVGFAGSALRTFRPAAAP